MVKSHILNFLKKYSIIIIILTAGIFYRVSAFGNPALSIGTIDTGVYIEASEESFFSREFFTSGRPISVPLVYKVLAPDGGYNLEVVSEPALLDTTRDLHHQPGFDRIVIAQMIISIIGWSFLAFVFYIYLQNIFAKIGCAVLILLFAYSPQLSEWDRILFSESLSFSLFALMSGFMLIVIMRFAKEGKRLSRSTILLLITWALVYALWVFTRDTNAYLTLVIIPIVIVLLFIPAIRRKIPFIACVSIVVFLGLLFAFQQKTMHESGRWVLPFESNLIYRVIPYPDRVEYFEKLGMPVNEEILSFTNLFSGPQYMDESEEFSNWIYTRGTSSWMKFLVDYPLWSVQTLYHELENLFYENLQPWYSGPEGNRPLELILLGDYLHPKSHAIIPIVVLLTMISMVSAINSKDTRKIMLSSYFLLLLAGEGFLLFISYYGDPRSIIRHALVAVVPIRLSIWLLLMVLFDFSLSSVDVARERKNDEYG